MTAESDVEAIAKGLTVAQREIIHYPSRAGDWRETYAYRMWLGAAGVNAARQLTDVGILEVKQKPFWKYATADFRTLYRLTPLGLDVRSFLTSKAQPHDR